MTLVLLLMLAAVAPALVAGQCWSTTSAAYSYNRVEEGETLTVSNYQNSESCWFYFPAPPTGRASTSRASTRKVAVTTFTSMTATIPNPSAEFRDTAAPQPLPIRHP